jgi:hypothetical protein
MEYLFDTVANQLAQNNVQNFVLENREVACIYDETGVFYVKGEDVECWCLQDGTLITMDSSDYPQEITTTTYVDQLTAIRSIFGDEILTDITDIENVVPCLYANALENLSIQDILTSTPDYEVSIDIQYAGYQDSRIFVQWYSSELNVAFRYIIRINTENNTIVEYEKEHVEKYLVVIPNRYTELNRAPVVPQVYE